MTSDSGARLNTALAGRYRIVRPLGSGGTATVYEAEDVTHRRPVAIKVLNEDLAASVGSARFLREIEIAAQLQHPNILPLLDSGDADGLLYYVMPLVDGPSLRARLTQASPMPVPEALRLLTKIVDALGYAHQRGVVHRDVKPDNIMISGRHALVADFGIARAVSRAASDHQVTSVGCARSTSRPTTRLVARRCGRFRRRAAHRDCSLGSRISIARRAAPSWQLVGDDCSSR